MSERTVDVIVIGGGPAGEVCAGRLGEAGLEVVLVERELVGGECSYWACMPSKALLRPAQALAEVGRVPGAAQAVNGGLDVQAVLDRRDEVIHDLDDDGQLPWLDERGVSLVRGRGRLDGERRVRVDDDGTLLGARRAVVVATGSVAALPPVTGLEDVRPWGTREATTAKHVPGRLLVLGGGVAGVELAQAYAWLGAEVTLVEPAPRVLAREEEFASEQVAEGLREAGVTIHTETQATAARREGDGTVALDTDAAGALAADELLVAAGRRPHTEDLGLDTVGLTPGEPIEVDDTLRSASHPWLYAIGDVNGRQPLTHMGKYQARLAADRIAGRGEPAVRGADSPPPRVVFTEPQVAAVGHTMASARAAGLDVRAVDVPTSGTAGASFVGRNAPGTSRLVVDRDRDVVAGATFTGADVQDFLHAATIAVVSAVPLDELRHAVPAFPTRSEVWLNLLEAAG